MKSIYHVQHDSSRQYIQRYEAIVLGVDELACDHCGRRRLLDLTRARGSCQANGAGSWASLADLKTIFRVGAAHLGLGMRRRLLGVFDTDLRGMWMMEERSFGRARLVKPSRTL